MISSASPSLKVFVGRVVTEVRERQDGDRWACLRLARGPYTFALRLLQGRLQIGHRLEPL
jgi:hypothetical protein